MPPICVMCGWVFEGAKGLRMRDTGELQSLVRRQWRPGPFAYAGIMTIADPTTTCCAMCLKRRRGNPKIRGPKKSMMPMDEYILSLLAPGRSLDRRRQKRMRRSLLRDVQGARNPFAAIPWILSIAQAPCPIRAWWDRNLRTKYFRHKATARAVRMMIRDDEQN